MIDVCTLRTLDVCDGTFGFLSAASGLVRIGQRLYVVADDENSLGVFNLEDGRPGRLFPLFDGKLPSRHRARKAAKPDLEALAVLPPFPGYRFGALLALGSGSRDNRQRAALVGLDAEGALEGAAHLIDMAALFAPLRTHFGDLNIEGAFVDGGHICLLQRGNQQSPMNACIRFNWNEFECWIRGCSVVPPVHSIAKFDLGHIDGVSLSFTDGVALSGGRWAFCAAAEDTSDSYADGRCAGSAVGIVNAAGELLKLEPLADACKVEGIAAATDADSLELLLVTDADDRGTPALLLAVTMSPV